jgi:hypothetical protein
VKKVRILIGAFLLAVAAVLVVGLLIIVSPIVALVLLVERSGGAIARGRRFCGRCIEDALQAIERPPK